MSTFKPYDYKGATKAAKAREKLQKQSAPLVAQITECLKETALFIGSYPWGAISYRDENGVLWEIKIEKSDSERAEGEGIG